MVETALLTEIVPVVVNVFVVQTKPLPSTGSVTLFASNTTPFPVDLKVDAAGNLLIASGSEAR